jgi:glycosyltransferase involved in cell wall biosynthesis
MKAADLVTVTNEALRDEVIKAGFNKNVEIIPNGLPFGEDQFTDIREKSDRVRFIYTGGITHERDVRIVKNPMKRLAADPEIQEKAHFQLCGFQDNEAWHRMVNSFTCGFKLPSSIRTGMKVTEYMNFYNEADCLLVPLVDSVFNSMKSNLKVLEAAAKKIPVITSAVMPYMNCPHAIKVKQQTDWYKKIKTVLNSPDYRHDKGMRNYQWCNEHFNLKKINESRQAIYSSLCDHRG